jgi:hypothetical protein
MSHRSAIVLTLGLIVGICAPAHADVDWKKVEQALGKEGVAQPGGIYRFGLPRSDIKVMLDGVELRPALALGSWLAFKDMGNEAMVMGDLVLTQDEVNPVMKRLAEGGVAVTALHNHLLRSAPATMYMHVAAHGDPVKLAETLRASLAFSKTPFTAASGTPSAQTFDLDMAMLDTIIGQKGKAVGGVYQFSIARAETIRDNGMEVPPAMGTATAINFQSTGNGKAAVTGDFVLIAGEVNPVLRGLRESGIEVTAVHNHMLADEPHLYFLHFWANDDAATLARSLKAVLDRTNVVHG